MNRFKNTRIRIERLRDKQFFGGWFVSTVKDRLLVDLSHMLDLNSGEPVRLHMICNNCEATLDTVYVQGFEGKAIFAMPSSVRIQGRKQDPRFRVHRATVTLETRGRSIIAGDVDIASKGIGLEAPTLVEVGEKAEIQYLTDDFEGTFEVECRHCHGRENGNAHMGFKIISTNRCLMARWQVHLEAIQFELMQTERRLAG